MKTQVTDSKQEKLDPNEILIIAAHQNKDDAKRLAKQAKKSEGISPERLLYTVYVEEIRNPALVRIQEGNTLFVISPMPERVGFLRVYNADTAKNYINNCVEFASAAYKVGFDVLVAQLHHRSALILDASYSKYKNPDKKLSKKSYKGGVVAAWALGKKRG